jgi:hypothetical protein
LIELARNRGTAEAVRAGVLRALESPRSTSLLGRRPRDAARGRCGLPRAARAPPRPRDGARRTRAAARRTIERRTVATAPDASSRRWRRGRSRCDLRLAVRRQAPARRAHTAELFSEPFPLALGLRRRAARAAQGLGPRARSRRWSARSTSSPRALDRRPGSKVSLAGMARAVLDLARIRARTCRRRRRSAEHDPLARAARSRSLTVFVCRRK